MLKLHKTPVYYFFALNIFFKIQFQEFFDNFFDQFLAKMEIVKFTILNLRLTLVFIDRRRAKINNFLNLF